MNYNIDFENVEFNSKHTEVNYDPLTTLYFLCPIETLKLFGFNDEDIKGYDKAYISIEAPSEAITSDNIICIEASPAYYNERAKDYMGEDWRDATLTIEEIEKLLQIAEKEGFEEKTTSSNIRYVVINTYDREIMKVGVSKTPSGATEIMKTDFMKVFLEYYEEEDFENEVGCGDEWEFDQTEAWLNTQGLVDYDWRIIEVSDDELQ